MVKTRVSPSLYLTNGSKIEVLLVRSRNPAKRLFLGFEHLFCGTPYVLAVEETKHVPRRARRTPVRRGARPVAAHGVGIVCLSARSPTLRWVHGAVGTLKAHYNHPRGRDLLWRESAPTGVYIPRYARRFLPNLVRSSDHT